MKAPTILLALVLAVAALTAGRAQSPAPITLQAASAVPASAAVAPAQPSAAGLDLRPAFQLLQEMKAANDATLKKQEAALQALDVLQKAAEEIKIFSKRG